MVAAMQRPAAAKAYRTIAVRPLTLHIGAEIEGVDLKQPLPATTVAEIRDAFVAWKVVFFRGQHLDHAQQVAFARQFGEPTIGHPVFGHEDAFPEVYSVAKRRTAIANQDTVPATPWKGWHTDITAAVNPPLASILRGVTIPPYGGDTWWTDLAGAYRGLSEPMRRFAETLRGIHRFAPSGGEKSEYDAVIRRRLMVSEHPLVAVHPESGERVLFVSPNFLKSVAGFSPRESQKLLEFFWEHAVRPEYTVRFKWQAGDVAFWDNRSTAHLAPTDIFESDFDRQLYRITLVGKPLVGIDGQTSKALEGLPILSCAEELARA